MVSREDSRDKSCVRDEAAPEIRVHVYNREL